MSNSDPIIFSIKFRKIYLEEFIHGNSGSGVGSRAETEISVTRTTCSARRATPRRRPRLGALSPTTATTTCSGRARSTTSSRSTWRTCTSSALITTTPTGASSPRRSMSGRSDLVEEGINILMNSINIYVSISFFSQTGQSQKI